MRTIIFRAMVLVLGLFTVTALFASGLVKTAEVSSVQGHYYFNVNADQENDWQDASNWPLNPPGASCDSGEERICRLPVNEDTEDLQEFLNGISYNGLLEYDFIEFRSEPQ